MIARRRKLIAATAGFLFGAVFGACTFGPIAYLKAQQLEMWWRHFRMEPVLVASDHHPPDLILDESRLSQRAIPSEYVRPGWLKVEQLGSVRGRIVRAPITQGDPIEAWMFERPSPQACEALRKHIAGP